MFQGPGLCLLGQMTTLKVIFYGVVSDNFETRQRPLRNFGVTNIGKFTGNDGVENYSCM